MSNKPKNSSIKTKNKTIDKKSYVPYDNKINDKYFILVIPFFTIIYYYYSTISTGFYQDDEIGQFINMLQFWHDPLIILGNGPKPGYKIFLVIPALFGYNTVLLINSIIASVTVYLTYKLIKVYKVEYAVFVSMLLAIQPLFLELSFRSYSEIFTALCIILFLISYKKEKFLLSGLILGYIFTVRQEIALLIVVIAVLFIKNKHYASLGGLFVFPVIYLILGYIKSGDIYFIFSEMQNVAALNYKSQGLFHYFKVYIFIVGPVTFILFAIGFFGFFNDLKNYKKYISQYILFYLIFVIIFITQMLTMLNNGPNPGNWRYLLHISPVCAFFAVIGFNNLSDIKFKKTVYYITGAIAVFILVFSSKATDGFILLDKSDYTRLFVIIIFFGIFILFRPESKYQYLNKLSLLLFALALIHLLFTIEPKKISPEIQTIKSFTEEFDNKQDADNNTILSNHTFILFYSKQYLKNPEHFKSLNMQNLSEAPPGSFIIWESHYGYRPEFKYDVKPDLLTDSTKYGLLKQSVTPDKRFAIYLFKKL